MEYFLSNDVDGIVGRRTEDGGCEVWDYVNKKWDENEVAKDVVLDIFNHKAISEDVAKAIIKANTIE